LTRRETVEFDTPCYRREVRSTRVGCAPSIRAARSIALLPPGRLAARDRDECAGGPLLSHDQRIGVARSAIAGSRGSGPFFDPPPIHPREAAAPVPEAPAGAHNDCRRAASKEDGDALLSALFVPDQDGEVGTTIAVEIAPPDERIDAIRQRESVCSGRCRPCL